MQFRRRQNDYFATISSAASRDAIGVVTETGIEVESWLGTIDRVVARHLPKAASVLLDIEGWRATIIDAYDWFPGGTYMVGARVAGGVVGILDGRQPMLRKIEGRKDRLGRTIKENTEAPLPSYMRTL